MASTFHDPIFKSPITLLNDWIVKKLYTWDVFDQYYTPKYKGKFEALIWAYQ